MKFKNKTSAAEAGVALRLFGMAEAMP